jgi:hypothetical protein
VKVIRVVHGVGVIWTGVARSIRLSVGKQRIIIVERSGFSRVVRCWRRAGFGWTAALTAAVAVVHLEVSNSFQSLAKKVPVGEHAMVQRRL